MSDSDDESMEGSSFGAVKIDLIHWQATFLVSRHRGA